MAQPLFGLVPANLPCITTPTETPSPTSLIYSIPADRPFSHVVIFLLPGVVLPDATAAAIYLLTPPSVPGSPPVQRFLGGIGPGKESAIFNLRSSSTSSSSDASQQQQQQQQQQPVLIGISIEPAASVAERIAEVKAAKEAAAATTGSNSNSDNSNALVVARPSTLVLAQRIIQNAFNFLASFSGTTAGQVEVVPLKAFEEWWRKFEGRVRADPGFLERAEN
ncbi:hypothetical protein MAPG_04983 [Magnaporthiopsis poae ATCC 64411]|uniref:Uncharacterized protein n=1 Tax=Magnaporthiopsis poae (strain ATCC 64411 / 73-15) TaxID=644358 RepID=A0A0C4DY72_MAGP6|nr:hypothetical protein MAPG_04983 [Magnaporthiopsis poae ATCC 64411]